MGTLGDCTGVINTGAIGVLVTCVLSVGSGMGAGGNTVGTLGSVRVLSLGVGTESENIFESWSIARSCASPIGSIGEAGEGFWSAQQRSFAALVAASADDSWGIFP